MMADSEGAPPASSSSTTSSLRNFRSSYYEKLGFCGNEEKNLLESLLTANPFDIDKLNDHLRERLDLDRRCVDAWKVLLGVECGRKNPFEECTNVERIRGEHFFSLKHHLEVLLKHNLVMRDRLKKQRAVSNNDNKSIASTTTSSENQQPAINNDDHRNDQSNLPHLDPSSTNYIYSSLDLQNHRGSSLGGDRSNRGHANDSMMEEIIEPHRHITPVGIDNRTENNSLELVTNHVSNGTNQISDHNSKKLLDDIEVRFDMMQCLLSLMNNYISS